MFDMNFVGLLFLVWVVYFDFELGLSIIVILFI